MDTLLIILLALTTVAIPVLTRLRLPLTSSTHGDARILREDPPQSRDRTFVLEYSR